MITVADILERIKKTKTEPTICNFGLVGVEEGKRVVLQTGMGPHIDPDYNAQGSNSRSAAQIRKCKAPQDICYVRVDFLFVV